MKHVHLRYPTKSFKVVGGTKRSQAAEMAIAAGDSEGGPDNHHAKSDQWLYVIAGQGKAIVEGKDVELRPGSLLLVEAGEAHEIVNTGRGKLRSINVYALPAY